METAYKYAKKNLDKNMVIPTNLFIEIVGNLTKKDSVKVCTCVPVVKD